MSFFVAGGTVPPGSPSYVERSADRELFEALLAGEYCYVLNSRQMGKSSLAVRTIAKLNEAGVRTAFVDLTKIGGATTTPEQWYASLLLETGRALGVRSLAASFLRDTPALGGAARFFAFLSESAMEAVEGSFVLMIDEIDATRSLPFSTDEFFAGIRQLHNARASDARMARLTLCLLGAALPSDLIRDARITPFNVGRRIELRDFDADEARPFGEVVGPANLAKVLYWTGGHPFLTQTLCAELDEYRDVDALVRGRYLDARARETDSNLADVGNRLLGRGAPNVGEGEQADTLSLYARMLKGGIEDDESNPSAARIKMSGVARIEGGSLKIRNRIYERAFGKEWIRENMPGQELRRQRKAFWRGALRTGAAATTVVSVVGILAWRNAVLAREASAARAQAEYELYAARMSLMTEAWSRNDLDQVDDLLRITRPSPHRGLEWDLWRGIAKGSLRHRWAGGQSFRPELSPGGRWVTYLKAGRLAILDAVRGREQSQAERPFGAGSLSGWANSDIAVAANAEGFSAIRAEDGRELWRRTGVLGAFAHLPRRTVFLLVASPKGLRLEEVEAATGHRRGSYATPVDSNDRFYPCGDDRLLIAHAGVGGYSVDSLDLKTGSRKLWRKVRSLALGVPPDASRIAVLEKGNSVDIYNATSLSRIAQVSVLPELPVQLSFSEDLRYLGIAYSSLHADLYDIAANRLRNTYRGTATIQISNRTKTVLTGYRSVRVSDLDGPPENGIPLPSQLWTTLQPEEEGRFSLAGARSIADMDVRKSAPVKIADFGGEPLIGDDPYPGGWILVRGDRAEVIRRNGSRSQCHLSSPATFASLSADGKRAVFLLTSGKAAWVDTETGRERWAVPALPNATRAVISPWGDRIAVSGWNGDVALLRAEDGKKERQLRRHEFLLHRMRFDPSGNRLLTMADDDLAAIWDVRTGRRIELTGHSYSVVGGDFSPDGRRVVTASIDRSLIVWDAATGRRLTRVPLPELGRSDVRFVDGGRKLAVLIRNAVLVFSCGPEGQE